ncbi:hypothetical protein [Streptococcus suis]|uniref:hypothetical protein n=1 Tax=Streptococcus suis TaxID=1307 RepID=UPI000C1987A2|nr:hypothetical protein [Streptococcus suis]
MEFKDIPKSELARLMVNGSKLSISDFYSTFNCEERFSCLGIRKIHGGKVDYEIFDWSYYDVLKKNGITPNLANMVALHNYILSEN